MTAPVVSSVAAIVPAYNEPPEAIDRTLRGLLGQSHCLDDVILVDDASTMPALVAPELEQRVALLRLSENGGVSTARNRAVELTTADYLLFVNCDVVLDPSWVQRALSFLDTHENVGAVSGRIIPVVGRKLLLDWRMHFIEPKFHRLATVPTKVGWLVGHVYFLRRRVFEEIGGFDPELWLRGEDWAFSQAVVELGYDLYHLPELVAESYEPTTIGNMAFKRVRNAGWDVRGRELSGSEVKRFRPLAASASVLADFIGRAARNVARRRFALAPLDAAIALRSLAMVWGAARRR